MTREDCAAIAKAIVAAIEAKKDRKSVALKILMKKFSEE